MKRILWAAIFLSGTAAAESGAPSYYDLAPEPVPYISRPAASSSPSATRRRFKVDADDPPVVSTAVETKKIELGTPDTDTSSQQVSLPPNMERGVKDLEAGMDELGDYTATMAGHIQKNGLRGFLAIPPELRNKGKAVGSRIGSGINGIATDVAHDLVVPERQ